jgi:hypothetical protein
MFNTVVIDIVIGLIFIYLLYSLLATLIQEIVATTFSFRAKILERGIVRMLEDDTTIRFRFFGVLKLFRKRKHHRGKKSLSDQFYNHPMIKYLAENKEGSKPSYIKRTTFSKVVTDLLRGASAKPDEDFVGMIENALDEGKTRMGNVHVDTETLIHLRSMWADAGKDFNRFKRAIEDWYDETMDRVSGWYKKYTQIVLLIIGIVIAVIFDVDSIDIVKKLEKDPKLRDLIVEQANRFAETHPDLVMELEQDRIRNAELVKAMQISNDQADSLKKELDQESLELYEQLKARRDSLFNAATDLLQEDLSPANRLLGGQIWSYEWKGFPAFLQSIFGWFLTALAVSLGAPFWFDLLNKMMKLRSSIVAAPKKKDTKPEIEGGRD